MKDLLKQALDAIEARLHRIESACMSTAPKQAVGEMLSAMREMPEWGALRAAIAQPEPYDQQALEPCDVCGWKAIVPGEPCLMCERNARLLQPDEPVTWIASEVLRKIKDFDVTVYGRPGFDDAVPLYTRPAPYVPLSDDDIKRIQYSDPAFMTCSCVAFARAVEQAVRGAT